MAVVDIHTHMLSDSWLAMLREHGGRYALADDRAGGSAVQLSGVPFMTLTPGMFDYALRIQKMDEARVDLAVVSLTCPNVYWGDQQVSAAAAAVINDDMAAAQRAYPGRIRWLASLPWQFPDAALAELARACDAGAVGVMVLANIDGAELTAARFAGIWAEIDRRELPVLLHPTIPPGAGEMGMNRYHLAWSVGFTFDTTLALSRMILDGFFDRYARLKIIGAHAGGYLPFLLPRLDHGHARIEAIRETIAERPGSYARRMYVDSIAYSVASLAFTVAAFGAENVLYGSDYPHNVGDMPGCLAAVDALPGDTARLVRGGNAERIFKL